MLEVTEQEFFETVGQMDVHPRPERSHSSWETRSREVIGRSEPGYLCTGRDGCYTAKKRYWVADRLAAKATQ